jgi:hypothetical protein
MSNKSNESTECPICCDELDLTNKIKSYPDEEQVCFCLNCANYMIENNFYRYIKEIANADCERSLKSALSEPIPEYLTVDSLKKSKQIKDLVCQDQIINCKLNKSINDLELDNLNKRFNQILCQIDIDEEFDYLGIIKELLDEFNLC